MLPNWPKSFLPQQVTAPLAITAQVLPKLPETDTTGPVARAVGVTDSDGETDVPSDGDVVGVGVSVFVPLALLVTLGVLLGVRETDGDEDSVGDIELDDVRDTEAVALVDAPVDNDEVGVADTVPVLVSENDDVSDEDADALGVRVAVGDFEDECVVDSDTDEDAVEDWDVDVVGDRLGPGDALTMSYSQSQ